MTHAAETVAQARIMREDGASLGKICSKSDIRFYKKKKVSDRRAEFGLLSIEICDVIFKQRLCGWIDWLKEQWAVSSSG